MQSPAALLDIVSTFRPGKSTRVLEPGEMNDMVVVEENEVFRFPRTPESCLRLEYESRVLAALDAKLTIPIPKLIELDPSKQFSVLSFIEGEVLTNHDIGRFSRPETDVLAKQLAQFMRELNAHMSVGQLDEWARELMPSSDTWDEYYASLAARKNGNSYLQRYGEQYKKVHALQAKAPRVPTIAIHGDLHAGNMLFKGAQLSGIIDFADCETGTIYNELRPLYSLGEDIVVGIIQQLDSTLGDIDLELVRETAILHELSVLARSDTEQLQSGSRVSISRKLLTTWLGDNWAEGENTSEIKAVIFDCFGVLTSERWIPFRRRYFHTDDAKAFARKTMGELVTGQLSVHEFVSAIAKKGNVDEDDVRESLTGSSPDDELFRWIATHKSDYKIGMLSNVGGDRLHTLFSPEQIALFDDIVLSYHVGMAKPDPRVYRLAAERLGVEPQECLFIDDKEVYCNAARAVGMQAVKYRDFEQFHSDIATIIS